MKYNMFVQQNSGYWCPMVFADEVCHKDAAMGRGRGFRLLLVSAGFVRRHPTKNYMVAYGESESLKLSSRPATDSVLLSLFLQEGLAGLDLANVWEMISLRQPGVPFEKRAEGAVDVVAMALEEVRHSVGRRHRNE